MMQTNRKVGLHVAEVGIRAGHVGPASGAGPASVGLHVAEVGIRGGHVGPASV
jgi:hypothetical protein